MDKYYFLINSLEWGWAERVTVNFADALEKKWKEVYIITLKSQNFYELPKGVYHIALSNIKSNLLVFLMIPCFAVKLKKTLKKHQLTEWMSLLEIANFVHILAKKDAVISFRIHINFFTGILWWIQKWLIKLLYPRASKIIVNSLENKYDLAEFLQIPLEKVEVVYNPLNKEKIKMQKKEPVDQKILEKIKNKRVFITTGRLVWQKHHELILEALTGLEKKDRVYLIIGDGPERKKLEELAHQLNIKQQVLFLGQQSNVFKYLAIADLFLYASEVEGFPNVLLEAREMGVPIITSDFKSGAKEVILGEKEYEKIVWKGIEYPYKGKHGWIIKRELYQTQFNSNHFEYLF